MNANYLERYALKGDQLARVWRGDNKSMGDAETLAEFLGFCHRYFPATHEAVILWDHGGGSAGGLVIDEQFKNDRLSLGELHSAFDRVFTADAKHPPSTATPAIWWPARRPSPAAAGITTAC